MMKEKVILEETLKSMQHEYKTAKQDVLVIILFHPSNSSGFVIHSLLTRVASEVLCGILISRHFNFAIRAKI